MCLISAREAQGVFAMHRILYCSSGVQSQAGWGHGHLAALPMAQRWSLVIFKMAFNLSHSMNPGSVFISMPFN